MDAVAEMRGRHVGLQTRPDTDAQRQRFARLDDALGGAVTFGQQRSAVVLLVQAAAGIQQDAEPERWLA